MAWSCIAKISNQTGEYNFAVIPVTAYNGPSGSSTTSFQIYGQRQSNSESGTNPAYYNALAVLTDLEAQGLENKFERTAGWTDFVYSSVGGRALSLGASYVTVASVYHQYDIFARHYTNFQTYANIGSTSASIFSDSNTTNPGLYWILLVNDEEEKIYSGYVTTGRYYERADHTPKYYDSVTIQAVIFDNGTSANLWETFKNDIPTPGPEPGAGNPYDGGGTSTPGEQAATWDDTSDVISVPAAPGFSLILNKLLHAWAPSVSDLDSIGTYLWSNFDVTDPTKTLSKVFQSPLESILTLHALPFAVSAGQAIELTLAGFATGVQLPPLTAQFKDIPCGSITIEPYWDNYLDYNPYTKLTLCLPFAGQVTLDPDEVMGKTVSVTYRVDCLTGSFVCFVFIDGDKVLGQYAGNCALSIPISAADYGRFNAAILGVAATAASAFGAAASGGLMTPMGLADGGMTITGGTLNAGALAGAGRQIGGSLVQNVQNAKVHVAHSGGLTGAPGFMGIQKPYLIIHRARQSVPENYGSFRGYPLNVTKTLGECSGFTSVREIHLDGIPLTEPELEELRGILEGGIII